MGIMKDQPLGGRVSLYCRLHNETHKELQMAHSGCTVAGATLSFVIAGHALADEGKTSPYLPPRRQRAMQDIAAEYKKREKY